MAVLSREEFDAIEFDAAFTGDHTAAAERMTLLAATGIQSETMPRAEAFVRAGEQWLLADNPEAAVIGFRKALADGGPVVVDPRVPLCRALFALGRHREAHALIARLKEEGRTDPRACDMIMELLVEQSDLTGALDWATAGVELILQGNRQRSLSGTGPDGSVAEPAADSYTGLRELLRLRYRIRNDLRLPEDEYDRMLSDLAHPAARTGPHRPGQFRAAVACRADTVSESASASRSTVTSEPSLISPASSLRASWSPIADWISRRSGRAP